MSLVLRYIFFVSKFDDLFLRRTSRELLLKMLLPQMCESLETPDSFMGRDKLSYYVTGRLASEKYEAPSNGAFLSLDRDCVIISR